MMEPHVGPNQLVSDLNLHLFVPTSTATWGLGGLAHMSSNRGELVRFDRTSTGWRSTHEAELGGAPRSVLRLGGDTLLVGTMGGIVRVILPHTVQVVHRLATERYTFPFTLARDRSGTIYVGMNAAIARLTPATSGYREDWLVPKACPKRAPTDSAAICHCHQ